MLGVVGVVVVVEVAVVMVVVVAGVMVVVVVVAPTGKGALHLVSAPGESRAGCQASVAEVSRSWITRPGHYANILGNFKHVGCGGSWRYWTQVFGNDWGSGSCAWAR